jgi:hypothetical protein
MTPALGENPIPYALLAWKASLDALAVLSS